MLSIDPVPLIVLIVEDEVFIRMNAVACVEDAGYRTVTVDSAAEALKVLHERDDIGALFTDIQMPGSMNGLELAHEVRRDWPALPILIASGRESPTETDMPVRARFLSKPYGPREVGRQLDEMVLALAFLPPVTLGTARK
jgi:two-component system, response regulator PdtaR